MLTRLDNLFSKISENRTIKAIRQGLLYNMPLIMVGSFILMILNLPIAAVQNLFVSIFGDNWKYMGLLIYKATFRIMSLSTLLSVSFAVAKENSDAKRGNHRSIFVVLITLACYTAFAVDSVAPLDESVTGTLGMFGAIVIAVLAPNVYFFISSHLPKRKSMYTYGSDAILQSSLANVVPALLAISAFALARVILDYTGITYLAEDFQTTLNETLLQNSESVLVAILYCLTTHVLWFFGIHGTNVMETVSQNVFAVASTFNEVQVMSGVAPEYILTKEFLDVFVFMGGAGCTLGLLIALFIAGRSSRANGIAKYSIFPALFNINEIMVYGLPIIFNPYYLVPFLLTPVVLCLSSFAAFSWGIVPLTSSAVIWTTPIFISGYISVGSIMGIALQIVNLGLAVGIYYPFVRLYERQISRSNIKIFAKIVDAYSNADPDNPPQMLKRNDEMGVIVHSLLTELRKNLKGEKSGLYMAFQPKTRGDGRVFGAEALLRWRHPVYGGISPLVVLGIAQEADLMVDLGAWIIDESFSKLKIWLDRGYNISMSVNLSPEQVKFDSHLAERVEEAIKKYGLDSQYMELELTEHAAMDQSVAARERIEQIKALGVSISIDDFGMGSSSLLYLRDFYANVVKLDISLVRSLVSDRYSNEIVRSIISLCRQLNAHVVAEGVETKEQIEILEELGCDLFQGWYFSRALPLQDFILYVGKHGLVEKHAHEQDDLPLSANQEIPSKA